MLRLILCMIALFAAPAAAHFADETHVRAIVLDDSAERAEDGGLVYLRVPVPLVFADAVARSYALGIPLDDPVLYGEDTAFGGRYRVSVDEIARDPGAFAQRLERALTFRRGGVELDVDLVSFRLSPDRPEAPFDSIAAATAALAEPGTTMDPVFGEAVVEYALRLGPGSGALTVQNALPEMDLSEDIVIDNHLARDTGARVFSATKSGQLTLPTGFPQSALPALGSFLVEGLVHIVTGFDHVFLVICFALGIGWSRQLFWVVTAFTLGHSVTLVMGASGLVPQVGWFIPVVEAGIAGSVVLSAIAAWQQKFDWKGGVAPVLLAGGIGLVHGFGFASFLSESLSPGTSSFVPALAGFNIGLELGQIVLVVATVAAFALIGRAGPRIAVALRAGVLAGVAVISGYWFIERAASIPGVL